ncbi:MAG: hypothetical protein IKR26_02225 [Lachnospiraceae bacterium]|nr:hypothetical protein [Lachnospiraceae bacterium]
MSKIVFHLKKTVLSPVFIIFLVIIMLLPPFLGLAGQNTGLRPAGFAFEGRPDDEGVRLAGYLQESGFVEYDSTEKLSDDVECGNLDAGVIIPQNLTERLSSGGYEESLTFVCSPVSDFPELRKGQVVSALYAVYAPYISAKILEEYGIDRNEPAETYHSLMSGDRLYTFELSTVDGAMVLENNRSDRFFLFGLSLLLFLCSWFCIASPLCSDSRRLTDRISYRRAFLAVYVPGAAVRALIIWGASAVACLIAGKAGFILPTGVYMTALTVFCAFLSLVPGSNLKTALVFLLATSSTALCPLFIDITLSIPAVSFLRPLAPPFWLWFFAGMI